MVEVKILGTGCPTCKRLEKVTRQALEELGAEATVTKVTNMMDILSYGIPATPGLVIDGEVASHGRVPPKAEIASMLAAALSRVSE